MRLITITLNKDEIMADVVSVAHVTGRRLNVAGAEEKASDIQTPDEGADLYVVARAMQEGLSMLRKECGRYLNVGRLVDDNLLEDVRGEFICRSDV
jgi:hypothetical protein